MLTLGESGGVLAALREKQLQAPDPEVAAFLESVAVDVMDKHANDADFPERMRDKARELLLK